MEVNLNKIFMKRSRQSSSTLLDSLDWMLFCWLLTYPRTWVRYHDTIHFETSSERRRLKADKSDGEWAPFQAHWSEWGLARAAVVPSRCVFAYTRYVRQRDTRDDDVEPMRSQGKSLPYQLTLWRCHDIRIFNDVDYIEIATVRSVVVVVPMSVFLYLGYIVELFWKENNSHFISLFCY